MNFLKSIEDATREVLERDRLLDLQLIQTEKGIVIFIKKDFETFTVGPLTPDEALGFIAHRLFKVIDREYLFKLEKLERQS